MSSAPVQSNIIRGRKTNRGGYPGSVRRGSSPHMDRKPTPDREPPVFRHLANQVHHAPNLDERTAYGGEQVVGSGGRPPSRQGHRSRDSLPEYAENFLLHERFEDFEDKFENPFVSIFEPDTRSGGWQSHHVFLSGGEARDRPLEKKHDPYLPPQLSSPNFSVPPGAPPLQPARKNERRQAHDTATLNLVQRADAQLRNHFARLNLGSDRKPPPSTPPGLSLPKIPTHKPRMAGPPMVSLPETPRGPGPIQRPQPRQLPHAPVPVAKPKQAPPPSLVREPLAPPGLEPIRFTKSDFHPTWPSRVTERPTVPLSSLGVANIDISLTAARIREYDAYMNGLRDMFKDYYRAGELSARVTRRGRAAGGSCVKFAHGTTTVVPTHFNPIRCVSGAELWLSVVLDYLDRLRIGKRTSKTGKKPHYLAMVYASHAPVPRPAGIPSPFLVRLETE